MSGLTTFNEADLESLRPRLLALTAAPGWADPLLAGRPFGDEERFGRIYLVAAAGRSAGELLGLLRERLDNDPVTELGVVRGELARITRLRLTSLLEEL